MIVEESKLERQMNDLNDRVSALRDLLNHHMMNSYRQLSAQPKDTCGVSNHNFVQATNYRIYCTKCGEVKSL